MGFKNSHALGVMFAFSAKVAGAGFGFVFSILLAQLLGAAGIGIYFLALTIVSIGSTIALLGLDNAVLRFASVAHNQGSLSTLAALYRQSSGLVVVTGVVVVLLIWICTPYIPLGGERADDFQQVLPIMLLALIPTSLVLLQGEFFKSVGAPGVATFVQSVIQPMLLVMGGTILLWQGGTMVLHVAFLYSIAATASLFIAVIAWSRRKPGLWIQKGHFDRQILLRASLPLLWVSSMNLVMGWTDILVLGFLTDSSTVGVYGVATRIATLTAFVLIAANSVIAPRFAALHAQGDHRALERLAQRSAGWILLAVLPIILFLLLFPEWLLQLFGADFVEGTLLLRILAIGQLINVAMGSVGYLLIMTGHERLMRNNIMLSAFINIIGNLVLVPSFGAMGAAISTACSLAFMNVVSFILVNRKLKINTMGYLFRKVDSCNSQ